MNILVTGCAGFIGSHLCERLVAAGHTVTGIDNFDGFYANGIKQKNLEGLLHEERFTFYKTDIRFETELAAINDDFEMVVHLAARAGVRPSIERPAEYIESNITGTQNIINLMRLRNLTKLVFASSSSVYGDKTEAPYRETAAVDFPISPYAFTKRSCELMLYTYFHLYQISSVALRFFTVYGPRQRPDLAINKFFTAIEAGQPIPVYGDGSTARDYTFVTDIVAGIERAIDRVASQGHMHEIINIGNSRPVTLLELIEKIEATIGRKATLQFNDMQPGDVVMTCADIQKAKRLLNYAPQVTLDEGLRRYYRWRNLNR